MTLNDQYNYLCEMASKAPDEFDKRKLMACAATMFDFWQDQHNEFIEEFAGTKTIKGNLVPLRLDSKTVAMVDGELSVKDVVNKYRK